MSDDDELMIRLQSGDPLAFQELDDRYRHLLLGFFISNCRDRQLAEDLTQDTLLKIYDQAWDYLPSGKFRGWLFRIARNLLIDTVRKQSHDALVRAVTSGEDDESPMAGLVAEVTSPPDQAGQRELVGLVEELLQQMPDEQRLTFLLHHFSELSLPEVAEIMEANLPTTKSRLRLAREKLREKLLQRGIVDAREWISPENRED